MFNHNGNRQSAPAVTAEWLAEQRAAMVEQQLRRRGIRDKRVLAAMSEVPRHEFVPSDQIRHAYEDRPLPIGQGQTISQPYMVALMLEALELGGRPKVLDVGSGSSYQTAVLASLGAQVVGVELDPVLAASSQRRLSQLGVAATVIEGDGSLGYSPDAPYDGIVVGAAAPEVPQPLLQQLAEGGRLVVPVGNLEGQELRVVRKTGGQTTTCTLGSCLFVPLTGAWGWRLD